MQINPTKMATATESRRETWVSQATEEAKLSACPSRLSLHSRQQSFNYRRYFEEKQKEQEEREHEIREQILQQRKQKFEEVTEKFQRAHIPLSQRRRPVFQKPVPPLEEALKQIQESNLKSQVSSSYRPTINLRMEHYIAHKDVLFMKKVSTQWLLDLLKKNLFPRGKDGIIVWVKMKRLLNFGQRVQLSSSKPKEATLDTSNIEEVSDSTSEFLMAENLVKSSVTVDDILSVMSNKQLQKTNLALNKTQQLDICALSAEEQKVLQSLNRLNERLFYVQATICKNPSIKNALQIMPLLNMQPRTSLSPNLGSRLHRKY
uniref:Centrosomal protein 126 n=1 Tax=Pipistrellus kuhlii TaxID=59472 RepID=A0A7J7WZ95_PIPKU|nr:centrosomal protein 126 [Pipistrellus kuhlii]